MKKNCNKVKKNRKHIILTTIILTIGILVVSYTGYSIMLEQYLGAQAALDESDYISSLQTFKKLGFFLDSKKLAQESAVACAQDLINLSSDMHFRHYHIFWEETPDLMRYGKDYLSDETCIQLEQIKNYATGLSLLDVDYKLENHDFPPLDDDTLKKIHSYLTDAQGFGISQRLLSLIKENKKYAYMKTEVNDSLDKDDPNYKTFAISSIGIARIDNNEALTEDNMKVMFTIDVSTKDSSSKVTGSRYFAIAPIDHPEHFDVYTDDRILPNAGSFKDGHFTVTDSGKVVVDIEMDRIN